MIDNNKEPDFLFHYTNLDTFRLILQNKTIKFSPLDKLDDLDEGKTVDAIPIRRCQYISCWTDKEEESIPMWREYASVDKGVKIKMKKYPFKRYPIQEGSMKEKLLMPSSKFKELPYSLVNLMTENNFLKKVVYTDDEKILFPKVKLLTEEYVKIDLGEIGKYKSKEWSYQNEWRYILTIIPSNLFDINSKEKLKEVYSRMENPKSLIPAYDFFLDISDTAISTMEIVMSPCMEERDKIELKNLLNKYAPKAGLLHSSLEGKIRF